MKFALLAAACLAVIASSALADEHRAPKRSTSRLGATTLGSTNRRLGEVPNLSKFAATIVAVLEDSDSQKLPPGDLQASVLKELNLDDDGGEDEEIAEAYEAALEKLERKGVIRYNSAGTKIKLDELDDSKDKGESGGSKRDDDDDSKDGGKDDDKDKEDSPDYQLEPEDGTDSDQDGIADEAEDAAGTDPNDPDSDRDGATDGQEAGAGTDGMDPADTPDVSDKDMENVSDVLEEIMGTDPADPDTDKDGARYVPQASAVVFFLICSSYCSHESSL